MIAIGEPAGCEASLRRPGSAPTVPPPVPSGDPLLSLDITPPPRLLSPDEAVADPAAAELATLTDTIEYCTACFVRTARVHAGLNELVAKAALGCVVSLLGMKRQSIVDGASRVIYAIACSHDAFLTKELMASRESVRAVCHAAAKQVSVFASACLVAAPQLEGDGTTRSVAAAFGALHATASSSSLTASGRPRRGDVETDADVTSPLHRLISRTILSLSNNASLVGILVSCRMGEALMQLFRGTDATASRWALLSLCELFQVRRPTESLRAVSGEAAVPAVGTRMPSADP